MSLLKVDPGTRRCVGGLSGLPMRVILAAICGAGTLPSAGCGRRGQQRYIPGGELAQQALTATLDAWKSGAAPGRIASLAPAVHVADTQRKSGQALRNYEILGELPTEGGRRYSVRLNLSHPAQELQAQYVVVGLDPLWVFRQEDYDMLLHWDHPVAAAGSKSTGRLD